MKLVERGGIEPPKSRLRVEFSAISECAPKLYGQASGNPTRLNALKERPLSQSSLA